VRRSLRTNLILWNVVTIASLLTVTGFALVWINQERVRARLDEDLRREAGRAADLGPPGGPQPPPMFPREGRRPGFAPQPPQPPPEVFAEVERIADLRRPRFFDRDGLPMGPGNRPPATDDRGVALALQGTPVTATIGTLRVRTAPIRRPEGIVGAVQVVRDLRELEQLWLVQLRTLLILLPFAILAAAGGAIALTNRALRPIGNVTHAARAIGSSSDLSRRLDEEGNDELAELARTFNAMLGRLESSFIEMQSAYERQQRFTADASHELRTPLTRLRLATSSALREGATESDRRMALETSDRAADTMARLVQQLLVLARADAHQLALDRSAVDLRVVVAEALDEVPAASGRVQTRFAEGRIEVLGDATHLRRVVVNLVENAIRHTAPTRRIQVEVGREHGDAFVTVTDEGEGIPPEDVGRVFERFYRVDAARDRRDGGSGLGLAIVKSLVEAQGGSVELRSKLGSGTQVRVVFPVLPAIQTKTS